MLNAMKKLCLIFGTFFGVLLTTTFSLATEEPHIQRDPFARTELTSCTNAMRVRNPTYLGIEITPAENWQVELKELNITPSQSMPVEWFRPFNQPFADRQLYPISTVMTHKTTQPITFDVTGTITACSQGDCADYPLHLQKTLGHDQALIIPECDSIVQALVQTPVPMHMAKVEGWAIPNKKGDIQVTLVFQNASHVVQIYDQEKHPLDLAIQLQGKQAQFIWPQANQDVHFFAKTYYGYYDIQLSILPENTKIPLRADSVLLILQAAFLFFLFSAFPLFWARSTDTPYPLFLKQTKQAIYTILAAGILFACVLYFKGPLDLAYYPISKCWALVIMGIGALFVPAHLILAFLFTLLVPKPYLALLQTTRDQIIFSCCATLIGAGAFIIQLIWAKEIFQKLQGKDTLSYAWWCGKLPWLGLMIYLILYL